MLYFLLMPLFDKFIAGLATGLLKAESALSLQHDFPLLKQASFLTGVAFGALVCAWATKPTAVSNKARANFFIGLNLAKFG